MNNFVIARVETQFFMVVTHFLESLVVFFSVWLSVYLCGYYHWDGETDGTGPPSDACTILMNSDETISTPETSLLKFQPLCTLTSYFLPFHVRIIARLKICLKMLTIGNRKHLCTTQVIFKVVAFKTHSHCAIVTDSSYHNKWVVQDTMEVFTLYDCENLTSSYAAHCKQNKSQ